MKVASIHLFRNEIDSDHYCGCWWIEDNDDPEVNQVLKACNVGKFRLDSGGIGRAFFIAKEIDEMVERAEKETGCITDVVWDNYNVK